MKKLAFFGIGLLLVGAGNSQSERNKKAVFVYDHITAIDSLKHVTSKLEASTLRLDKIVTKIQ